MTEHADESRQERVTCPAAGWLDTHWAQHEDSETRFPVMRKEDDEEWDWSEQAMDHTS